MTDDPLVSIIIPNFNYGLYIENCIKSVLNQTYENLEILIIDNNSSDDSIAKIKKFTYDKRVKFIRTSKTYIPGTIEYAKNVSGYAINLAKGEFISILYSDDWYLPNKISKQLEMFSVLPPSYGVVHCNGYSYDSTSDSLNDWIIKGARGYVFKSLLLNNSAKMIIPIAPLVRKSAYKTIGISNEWTGSEYDYFIMSQYFDFNYVDDKLVVMRDHDKNYRKSIFPVYNSVKVFHSKALARPEAIAREGVLIKQKIVRDYISYGLTFILRMDLLYGREAILDAIKISPFYAIGFKSITALIVSYCPEKIANKIIFLYKKFSRKAM